MHASRCISDLAQVKSVVSVLDEPPLINPVLLRTNSFCRGLSLRTSKADTIAIRMSDTKASHIMFTSQGYAVYIIQSLSHDKLRHQVI